MKINMITLLLATMATGLMGGIFFTWSNAVKPGIGKLTDIGYLESLQAMNKAILNPMFYLVFFAAVVLIPVATYFNYNSQSSLVVKLLFGASIVYFIGVFLVTFRGNIPLNTILEHTDLNTITDAAAKELRKGIEAKWNFYNRIRTLTSAASFIVLLIALVKVSK